MENKEYMSVLSGKRAIRVVRSANALRLGVRPQEITAKKNESAAPPKLTNTLEVTISSSGFLILFYVTKMTTPAIRQSFVVKLAPCYQGGGVGGPLLESDSEEASRGTALSGADIGGPRGGREGGKVVWMWACCWYKT